VGIIRIDGSFDPENEKPSFARPLLLQLVFFYPAVLIAGLPFFALYDAFMKSVFGIVKRDDPLNALGVFIFIAVGFGVGWLVNRRLPSLSVAGEWVWLLPVTFFLVGFIHDVFWRCQFCSDARMLYFYSDGSDEGLTNLLVTWPAFSAEGYSLGVLLSGGT
jgi:hypothetical protein